MANTLVGTWETTWESLNAAWNPGLTLTVTESFRGDPSGNYLVGMYDLRKRHPGTMHGPLSGNEWKGDWENSPTDKGTFTFTLVDDDSFTGTYEFASKKGEKKPWNGKRLRNHVPVKQK